MRKKLGSRELKLFEPVVVEFMFQELEFHTPRVQTSSYHIYEHGDPVPTNMYVLVRDCWSSQKPSPFVI